MNHRQRLSAILVAAVGVSGVMTGAVNAHEFQLDSVKIDHPWSRPTPPKASMGVVYMALENNGENAAKLLSVSCECAKSAEMHLSEIDASGKSSMRQQTSVEIPAGGRVEFAPGGLHVMLIGLKAGLSEGSSFPITLDFEKIGKVVVDVNVEQAPAESASDTKAHEHHH